MTKDTVEPEKDDKDKQGGILLPVHVYEEEHIEGKMRPEWIALESSLAGTGLQAPVHPRLSLREMQRTTVRKSTAADGSLETEEIILLQVVVGVKPDLQNKPPFKKSRFCRWTGNKERWWSRTTNITSSSIPADDGEMCRTPNSS